jgi:20S proteasome subunit beta 2
VSHYIIYDAAVTGPSLYTVHPYGSVDQLPFVTMGSGSLAAMAIYEAGYQEDMTKEQAVRVRLCTCTHAH